MREELAPLLFARQSYNLACMHASSAEGKLTKMHILRCPPEPAGGFLPFGDATFLCLFVWGGATGGRTPMHMHMHIGPRGRAPPLGVPGPVRPESGGHLGSVRGPYRLSVLLTLVSSSGLLAPGRVALLAGYTLTTSTTKPNQR